MTKKLWMSFAVLSFAILAGCANTSQLTQDIQEPADQELWAQAIEVSAPAVEVIEQEANAGIYKDYSDAALDQALADNQKIALFFHATRCPACRRLDRDLRADMDQLPADTVVFKVDYDEETGLKQQYGITMQHTVILIDENKNEAARAAGAGIAEVIALLQ